MTGLSTVRHRAWIVIKAGGYEPRVDAICRVLALLCALAVLAAACAKAHTPGYSGDLSGDWCSVNAKNVFYALSITQCNNRIVAGHGVMHTDTGRDPFVIRGMFETNRIGLELKFPNRGNVAPSSLRMVLINGYIMSTSEAIPVLYEIASRVVFVRTNHLRQVEQRGIALSGGEVLPTTL